ncbi:MAG TPA: hypothetical protein VGA62_09615, partial [Acidimicrobiia bacterium]
MTLDVRMREAADALDTPRMQVPSFEHIRRRRNRLRWRAGLLGMLALALPVGAAISLGSGNDSPRIVANPKPVTPRARTTDALGLAVQLPSGWLLQSGSCPAALTVTVIKTVKPLPVPAGCPPVDDPWAVVQRVPTDLDGIDRACGPGFIDDMPSCQAIERGSPGSSTIGTERRFYAGLDVLVSIHRTQAAGPS